jgi:hypothetical protein
MDDDPLIFESAEQFAQTLFLMFVIDDEPKIIRSLDLSASPTFDQKNYERQRFVYLVAIIALALTDRARKDNQFVAVLSHLRRMVRVEMQNRWHDDDETADDAIEEAVQDCAQLILSSPETSRGLSFTWPKGWLERSGVQETNPIRLFKMSYGWRQQYLTLLQVVQRARLTDRC